MEQYHVLLKEVLGRGDVQYEPRTQEYTLGLSSWRSVYDLRKGFPEVTTKNLPPRLPFGELFWKLRGERSVISLINENINFWTANAFDRYLREIGQTGKVPKHSNAWNMRFEDYKTILQTEPEMVGNGDLGPVYGYQWRHWPDGEGGEIDQLKYVLKNMRERPGSRYHVLSSWNVANLPGIASGSKVMAIGPCPVLHQFTTYKNGSVDLTMTQRSCDVFLGVPSNISQDSLLTHMVANETGFAPRFFYHHYNNVHAYLGVPPRSDFWMDEKNVEEFQARFNAVGHRSGYLGLKNWYLKNAPSESEGNERKDHVPFILEQLSKIPREPPTLEILGGVPLLDAIEMPAMDYAKLIGYDPEKWDSKAVMAA